MVQLMKLFFFLNTLLDNIVTDSKDVFVIKPSVEIQKTGDENG